MTRPTHATRWMRRAALGLVATAGLLAGAARAELPAAVGSTGAMERAALLQDAARGGTAASFGTPVTGEDKLFQLRWKVPLWVVGSPDRAPALSGALGSSIAAAGPVSLALDPSQGISALVPQAQLGHVDGPGYVQAGALSVGLGHGTLLDRYTNSPANMGRRAGLALGGRVAPAGIELMLGDLAAPTALFAGRVHVRPVLAVLAPDTFIQPDGLDLDPRVETLGMLVVGASWAVDGSAPGSIGGVRAAGVDIAAAVLDNQFAMVRPYLDINVLQGTKDGTGFGGHLGAELALKFFDSNIKGIVEGSLGQRGYVPRYFDRLYMADRMSVVGVGSAKATWAAPPNAGYRVRLSGKIFNNAAAFVEATDLYDLESPEGRHNLTLTGGADVWFGMVGLSGTVSQVGLGTDAALGAAPGFLAMGEGRVALLANVMHIVGRGWYATRTGEGGQPLSETAASIGLEFNLDVL